MVKLDKIQLQLEFVQIILGGHAKPALLFFLRLINTFEIYIYSEWEYTLNGSTLNGIFMKLSSNFK